MTPAGWYPDPFGRYQYRYWDGEAWTAHSSTDGISTVDAPVGAPIAMRTDVVHVDPSVITSEDKTWAVFSLSLSPTAIGARRGRETVGIGAGG